MFFTIKSNTECNIFDIGSLSNHLTTIVSRWFVELYQSSPKSNTLAVDGLCCCSCTARPTRKSIDVRRVSDAPQNPVKNQEQVAKRLARSSMNNDRNPGTTWLDPKRPPQKSQPLFKWKHCVRRTNRPFLRPNPNKTEKRKTKKEKIRQGPPPLLSDCWLYS